MRVLAMDAALASCSVALMEAGRDLGTRQGTDSRAATSSLPGLVQDLMAEHGGDFDAVAVTVGPGSFTGLRGALAFANGLALGAGVPIVGVTVAEALLAAGPLPLDRAPWIALDSRRAGRMFLGRGGTIEMVSIEALPSAPGPVIVLGDAAGEMVAALRRAGADAIAADATAISPEAVGRVGLRRLVGELPPCHAQPLYLGSAEARPASHTRPTPV